ncbi:glycosyltransferase [Candidatus Uhrbacteria bacterium]|nr:glycosyltransferase [Candidatus Uhrbacteria bacterium]
MIRLVHILTSFDIGGAEQLVLDLCRRLDRARFDVSVFAVVRGGPLRSEFHDAGIPTEVAGKPTRLGFSTIRHLTAMLESPRPDIVHTHLFGGDTWGRIAAMRAHVPHIVSTEHNINMDEGFVKRFVKRRLARSTERIVAVSDAVRSQSILVDRIPREKVVVIPNGVDCTMFRPSPRTAHDGVRLVTVGRLVPQKGHAMLIDAFAILRDTLPRAILTIVGDGPLRTAFEAQVHAYHLEDRILFQGFRRDRPEVYHAADIAVFPSQWEGLGIAALEASACGLPIIATSVGGLQEAVVDQTTGVLVPTGDPGLLATAIRELANDRPRQLLLGHAGRRHVERGFDIRKVVEQYERMYEAVLHEQ